MSLGGEVLPIKQLQPLVTHPPNTLTNRGKVGIAPQLFSATPRIYCSLFVTPRLFVLRGACGGGFRAAVVVVVGGTCDSPGQMGLGRVTLGGI